MKTNASARIFWFLSCAICVLYLGSSVSGAEPVGAPGEVQESLRKLKQMSLNELLNEQVSIVSKTPEKLSQVAASVQVISSEDIQRSGATSLSEALRLASNLEVAQVNARDWAISSRGFNNTLANKLLVMIDGRTIYTPLDAGVSWDTQSVLLEDIDRIEVVSGPGGALWGANAVNGVINVISKSAKDTQGTYVSAGAGSLLRDFGALRYGGNAGSHFFYRVYGQRFDRNNSLLANGNDAQDDWDLTQGGFRTDWYPSDANTLTFQADFYGGTERGLAADIDVDGQNVLGRWTYAISSESGVQVQTYFDRTWRRTPNAFTEDLKTYDLDIQHHFPIGGRQSLVWGGAYRLMQDRIQNSTAAAFLPARKDLHLFSTFIHGETILLPDLLKLSVGTKVEHNDYSGLEIQPSVRLAWTPDERQTVWGAVSRAVRAPSRIDTEYYVPAPPVTPGTPNLAGGPHFDSEKLLSYELGYRIRPLDKLSLSWSTYYNFYEDLRSLDQITPNNYTLGNHFRGEVWGTELSTEYQAMEWWRLRGGYNYINKHLWPHGGVGVSASVREGNDPEHQFSLQSILDLPAHFQFDVTGRFVSTLPSPRVASYVTFDIRLAWQYKTFEIALIGQNLCESKHVEFGTRQIPRSIFGKVTWRF